MSVLGWTMSRRQTSELEGKPDISCANFRTVALGVDPQQPSRFLTPKCPSGDFMCRMNRLSGAPS